MTSPELDIFSDDFSTEEPTWKAPYVRMVDLVFPPNPKEHDDNGNEVD